MQFKHRILATSVVVGLFLILAGNALAKSTVRYYGACGGGTSISDMVAGWSAHGVLDDVARATGATPGLDGSSSFLVRQGLVLVYVVRGGWVTNYTCSGGKFVKLTKKKYISPGPYWVPARMAPAPGREKHVSLGWQPGCGNKQGGNLLVKSPGAPPKPHYVPPKRHKAVLNYSCTGIKVQHSGLVLLATVTTRQSRGVKFAYASWNWGDKSKIQKTGSKTASHTYTGTFAGSVAVAVYFNVGSSTRVANCRTALLISGPAVTPAAPTTCTVNGVAGQVVNGQCQPITTTTTTTQNCGNGMHPETDSSGNVNCVANTNTNTNTNTQTTTVIVNNSPPPSQNVSYSPVCSAVMTSDKSNRVFAFDASKSTASNGSTPTGASWTFTKNGATVGTASGLSTTFTFADYQTVYNWTAVISFAGGSATCSGSVTTGAAPPSQSIATG